MRATELVNSISAVAPRTWAARTWNTMRTGSASLTRTQKLQALWQARGNAAKPHGAPARSLHTFSRSAGATSCVPLGLLHRGAALGHSGTDMNGMALRTQNLQGESEDDDANSFVIGLQRGVAGGFKTPIFGPKLFTGMGKVWYKSTRI